MTLTTKILSALLLAFALAGCGQSGPLYVPGDPSSVRQPPETPEATDEAEEDRDEDER